LFGQCKFIVLIRIEQKDQLFGQCKFIVPIRLPEISKLLRRSNQFIGEIYTTYIPHTRAAGAIKVYLILTTDNDINVKGELDEIQIYFRKISLH